MAGWRVIGGKNHYFKSLWEIRYAHWLQYQKDKGWIIDWKYEPKTFWFYGIRRGCVSYKPDFQVFGDIGYETGWYWVEVKGYMDARSATKIKRFKKYFPQEELRIVDKNFFKNNNAKLRLLIPAWESWR
jgi:hypothetical protein